VTAVLSNLVSNVPAGLCSSRRANLSIRSAPGGDCDGIDLGGEFHHGWIGLLT